MKKLKLIQLLPLLMLISFQYVDAQKTRTEKDLLGEKQIPFDAYYGVQTLRALENFQISGVKTNFYPDYVRAYAMVKLAAARANTDHNVRNRAVGLLPDLRARLLVMGRAVRQVVVLIGLPRVGNLAFKT